MIAFGFDLKNFYEIKERSFELDKRLLELIGVSDVVQFFRILF